MMMVNDLVDWLTTRISRSIIKFGEDFEHWHQDGFGFWFQMAFLFLLFPWFELFHELRQILVTWSQIVESSTDQVENIAKYAAHELPIELSRCIGIDTLNLGTISSNDFEDTVNDLMVNATRCRDVIVLFDSLAYEFRLDDGRVHALVRLVQYLRRCTFQMMQEISLFAWWSACLSNRVAHSWEDCAENLSREWLETIARVASDTIGIGLKFATILIDLANISGRSEGSIAKDEELLHAHVRLIVTFPGTLAFTYSAAATWAWISRWRLRVEISWDGACSPLISATLSTSSSNQHEADEKCKENWSIPRHCDMDMD